MAPPHRRLCVDRRWPHVHALLMELPRLPHPWIGSACDPHAHCRLDHVRELNFSNNHTLSLLFCVSRMLLNTVKNINAETLQSLPQPC